MKRLISDIGGMKTYVEIRNIDMPVGTKQSLTQIRKTHLLRPPLQTWQSREQIHQQD
jgi:hypothetical protein